MQISKSEILDRQNRLRLIMAERGVDAVCVGGSAQIDTRGILRYLINYYLPVFEEYLVIPRRGPVVFFPHDGSGTDYAKAFSVVNEIRPIPDIEYVNDPALSIIKLFKELGCKKVGTAWGRGISSGFYKSFLNHIGSIETEDFAPIFDNMRMVKSPAEILLMKDAVRLNENILKQYLKNVAAGRSETEAVRVASDFALQQGAEDLYWMASSSRIPSLAFWAASRQFKHIWQQRDYHYIVLEHSCNGGYYSEITQLISFGEPAKEYSRAYQAIRTAQKAAAALIRPGIPVSQLADAAQKALIDYGYIQEGTVPSPCIGHSQGLDAWERPRISGDEETIIRAGMRFNIHPSVTLSDGAKITSCFTYLSTEQGVELLSDLPDEIIII